MAAALARALGLSGGAVAPRRVGAPVLVPFVLGFFLRVLVVDDLGAGAFFLGMDNIVEELILAMTAVYSIRRKYRLESDGSCSEEDDPPAAMIDGDADDCWDDPQTANESRKIIGWRMTLDSPVAATVV
jgi:hypothetical protein